MSTANPSQSQVIYPETDGKPMGETDLHIHWTIRIRDILKQQYRGTQTYVASNLLVYYEEGVPRNFVVPDVFIVRDCDPSFRRTYKMWEEPSPPQVVFEVTSASSRREDEVWKPERYAQIGVYEYFLYDPSSDYLKPTLQGFHSGTSGFQPIEPDANGKLISQFLGISFQLDGEDLVLRDVANDEVLQTAEEFADRTAQLAEKRANDAVARAGDAEARADDAERRAQELEAELRRLREKLGE